jgi:hypothetical protein
MKHKLLYFLPVLLLLTTGCLKSTSTSATPVPVPNGTFSGQFRLLTKHNGSAVFDTTKSNITVTLTGSNSTFAVTGDTSTLHAGSYGTYGYNGTYISFADKTYPTSGTPVKVHLNGAYLYYYDGTNFQMLAYSGDTVSYQYDLKLTQ